MRTITLMITSLGSYMQDAGYEGHPSDVDIRSANKADFQFLRWSHAISSSSKL
jgi:hypothetical protein